MSDLNSIEVVFRGDGLLVVNKPTGLPTTSPDDGDCLVKRVRELDLDAERLHASSRLDAEVTGLVVFARTRRATKMLLDARERGAYKRLYVALSAAAPEPRSGCHSAAIGLDPQDRRRRRVVSDTAHGAKLSRTRYAVHAYSPAAFWLHLWPETGRTHQLRVHALDMACPLLGDKHYGGAIRHVLDNGRVVQARRVMLHCFQVSVPNPSGSGTLNFEAPIPTDFRACWHATGGGPVP